MKKIIIISYFFPPCGLTASQRIAGWANYLHQFGLYPIIITRNWDHQVASPADILKPGGKDVKHEKNEKFEVYYLPHKGSIRDRLYYKLAGTRLSFISKPFTLIELIGQNYFNFFTPFKYLKEKAIDLLKEDKEIEHVLISGNPFILFKFGYQIKKKFPQIKWIADYRDDWSTSEINRKDTFVRKTVFNIESKFEKKWLASAAAITSVSPWYTKKISSFTGRPGFTIYNGFGEVYENINDENSTSKRIFFLYNGTLYSSQAIEVFLETLSEVGRSFSEIKICLQFPGLAFDAQQAERVKEIVKNMNMEVTILPRISKNEVIAMQQKADVLIMFAHLGKKGVTSSKIFEYMSLKKPVLLFPSDNDIVEELITETEIGYVASQRDELIRILTEIFQKKMAGEAILELTNTFKIYSYSRENQAGEMANVIKSV